VSLFALVSGRLRVTAIGYPQLMSDAENSDQERLARNLSELLQELRVAQAGVQILFGFLLSIANKTEEEKRIEEEKKKVKSKNMK